MAKYTVNFSCGHTEEIELLGKVSERYKKIAYFEESGTCSECYRAARKAREDKQNEAAGLELVEMHYGKYKEEYADCKTEYNSYNPKAKTIKVWVPAKAADTSDTAETTEITEDYRAAMNDTLQAAQATLETLRDEKKGDEKALHAVDELSAALIKSFDFWAKRTPGAKDVKKYTRMLSLETLRGTVEAMASKEG